MFLPDRFVKGECPKCHAQDQYGDGCEVCGATYNPTDLINPRSVVSGVAPVMRPSNHYFFTFKNIKEKLVEWLNGDGLPKDIVNYIKHWMEEGLQDWDFSATRRTSVSPSAARRTNTITYGGTRRWLHRLVR